jgi:hypothetical protein
LVEVVDIGVRSSRGCGGGRSGRLSFNGHGWKGGTFRFDSDTFQLDSLLKSFV